MCHSLAGIALLTVPAIPAVLSISEPPLLIISPVLPEALLVRVPFTVSALPAAMVSTAPEFMVRLLHIAGDVVT